MELFALAKNLMNSIEGTKNAPTTERDTVSKKVRKSFLNGGGDSIA